MRSSKRIGVIAVALVAIAIVVYKSKVEQPETASSGLPRVLLVADLSQADKEGDRCEIIQALRRAGARGIAIQEHTRRATAGASTLVS